MGLVSAGGQAELDRYLGYYESYAESHAVLDQAGKFEQEVRVVAKALAACIARLRAGDPVRPDAAIPPPRPK
jgi:hypothetical protein